MNAQFVKNRKPPVYGKKGLRSPYKLAEISGNKKKDGSLLADECMAEEKRREEKQARPAHSQKMK